MAVKREKVHFETVDELLGAPVPKDATTELRIDQIFPFRNHPFKVPDDEKMQDLVESIRDNGVIVPVLVRPADEGTYEIISGQRRMHAAKLAGLTIIPAIIKLMTNDEATIAMVDANIQREEILPSERAFSLKMKMDAMRRQGKRVDLEDATCGTQFHKLRENADATKSREALGAEMGITGRQVQKYLSLTQLNSHLLEMVDEKHLTLTLGVSISYLPAKLQEWVYDYYCENHILMKEQIDALKADPNMENLSRNMVFAVLNEGLPKPKDNGNVSFSRKKLDAYFPKNFSSSQREEVILDLLSKWRAEQEAADV